MSPHNHILGRLEPALIPGALSRGLAGSDIDEFLVDVQKPRKANLSKARLRDREKELRQQVAALIGTDRIRFRHIRAGEQILVSAGPVIHQKVHDRGDFTFASVDLPSNGGILIGAARCSPTDEFNRVYGRVKAIKRVLAALTQNVSETRWALQIPSGFKPVTGWTIGAVQALRLKHFFLDGQITEAEYDAAGAAIGPFVKAETPVA